MRIYQPRPAVVPFFEFHVELKHTESLERLVKELEELKAQISPERGSIDSGSTYGDAVFEPDKQ